ncbi:radical SAM family heme chaperone HemW [Anaerococcus tetradius]|uniref:radical SAM family heme chaperone HemW n=1 Tax=Anaerococcus tetradius TaxID=33036 RepID=UPI0023F12598|nr:radical SAM family heme chaperone HemW [Anaerococcus tetradius]
MKKVGLYIHIPFCEKKCYYCDFTAFAHLDRWIEPYIKNLKRELSLYRQSLTLTIDTIYIGGGTPSYIDEKYISEIVSEVRKFPCEIKEFSLECNPNSINKNKLKLYEDLGVTRISLGVQSFDDLVLNNIGRNHKKDIAIRDIEMIKNFDFDLSFDLMLNLPGQDFSSIKKDLAYVKALDPDHISWYSLILDKGSRFYALNEKGKLELMDDDREVDIFNYIVDELARLNLNRYEISNFAKPGKESIHNKKYWDIEGYLACGLGASGFLSNVRYSNASNFVSYEKMLKEGKKPIVSREFISQKEREKEYIIFKLRQTRGINLEEFRKEFKADFLKKYKKAIDKFIDDDFFVIDDCFSFTKKGMELSNEFYLEII